ncbi:hypothetical protein PSQ90_07825 [Devosia rhodophyticola]|uniref:Mll5186 protein n=1 Tax=Devosia rhodophyticola TaxID=3026423 RepID=A0ABY7Z117_9HYPH|nr:hypothetical protein [Devosia rhodophyticola]WDR07316.1 hypothetical protein PSQ90_07825 [Devosia rhodophyticola]
MAINAPAGVAVVSDRADGEQSSYVDWPAIFAGIVLASAISVILLAFGSAVGLSFTNFHAREGAAPIWIGIAGGLWLLWVQISSFLAGGYMTGRLRRRFRDATEHESDVRDGAHGLLVWAGAAVLGTVIAIGGVGAAANAVGNVAQTATAAASNVADGSIDPNAYFVDTLLRSDRPVDAGVARDEAGRIFANSALNGTEVSAEDRSYLANVVAANTGLTPEEASARVDQVTANVEAARQQAVDAAEAARKTGIVAAFLLAASLLVSAVGAYWAASMGGRHRDEQTVFADVFPRY